MDDILANAINTYKTKLANKYAKHKHLGCKKGEVNQKQQFI